MAGGRLPNPTSEAFCRSPVRFRPRSETISSAPWRNISPRHWPPTAFSSESSSAARWNASRRWRSSRAVESDDFEFELAGSASAQIALGKPILCRAGAQRRFPSDQALKRLHADAFAGVPLTASEGAAPDRRAHGSLPEDGPQPQRRQIDPGNLRAASRRRTRAEAGARTPSRERTAIPRVCLAELRRHVAHRIRAADLHRSYPRSSSSSRSTGTAILRSATMPWPGSSVSRRPAS